MTVEKGMVYIFEGNGKGKTSAALGVAVRMLLTEKKVIWISWFKSLKWPISESRLPMYFKSNIKMYWTGEGFFIKTAKLKTLVAGAMAQDFATPNDHLVAARGGLNLAIEILESNCPPDLLVLDELIQAVNEGLIPVKEVVNLVKNRGKTHLLITGHRCPKTLIDEADLVTVMKKIKHPYDLGVLAKRGLDY